MSKETKFKEFIFVRYVDHVLYHRTSALSIQPQVRETVGWLLYECEQYVTLTWDRDAEPPTLKGGDPKASGMVLLKSDILVLKKLEVHELPLQEISNCHLNSSETIVRGEYALQPKKRNTQNVKGEPQCRP